MNTQVTAGAVFDWPLPPFFHPAGATFPASRQCLAEFDDGRIVAGELAAFDPERNAASLVVPGQSQAQRLDLDKLRMLTLAAPVALVRDGAAIRQVGTSEGEVAEERTFTVTFRDRKTLSGSTRGFVRRKSGLFLYQLGDDPKTATCCFVPAHQLGDVQVGPLLGHSLTGRQILSKQTLAAALDKQASLRQELLGKQLAERAIVTPEELKAALQMQREAPKLRLGDILVDAGAITRDQLDEALHIQEERRGRRLGTILIDMGVVTSRQVQMALSDKLGIPYINVREFRIDPTAADLIGAPIATRHQVLPLMHIGDSLVVAVENPLAMDFAQDLRFITGLTIVPVIANPDDLRARIAREYVSYSRVLAGGEAGAAAGHVPGAPHAEEAAPGRDLSKVRVEELAMALAKEEPLAPRATQDAEFELRITDNALVRLVNKIIIEAHAQGASDIHIESSPRKSTTRIRFRKDGDLEDYLELPSYYRNALVSRIKIMAAMDISEHRHSQDGKIDFGKFGPLPIELRVAVVPTINGMQDIVLRILGGVEPLPLADLGLCARDLATIKQMVTRSYGLILVCGPTGSGKTTTLHSVLHHINRPDIKIWTAEDPVEITQAGLCQVQINSKIDWTFAEAMRAFLRADPDVIMVGEMRDAETTKIGIEASLTGHLVFSTLHTNSACESVVRLLELGMDPFNFADALIGILSQRLARKLCSKCKRARPASDGEIADLLAEYCMDSKLEPAAVRAQWLEDYAHQGQLLLHEPAGCDACKGGYRGRLGVYELLTGTAQVKQLIRARGTVPQLVEAGQAGGMRLLRQDAIEKVLGGALDLSQARSASS
ncbi:MAG: Flp pilus assembly complex ATPase component TadA [Nevskia sp.]|nr:Flp pilus assembly complex ATPase component TadA [Nevskia sp.]